MKRRVRERVVGTSIEDEGEEVDGVGRELIVVVVVRWLALCKECDSGRSHI
jgi:hypothetical protein